MMIDNKADQIKHLWQVVYDLLRGPGKVKTYGSHQLLSPHFDEDLLNDIRSLDQLSGTGLAEKVEIVRAQVGLAQATGLLGDNDLEQINGLLDRIK